MTNMRQRLKTLVFALLPAIVLFGTLELLAWVAIHREIRITADPVSGVPYIYGMRIGRFGEWSVVPLNTSGYPDLEFTEGFGHEGCARVLVLGDSFTFGDSVDRHQNWVSLVRRSAAVQAPDRCIRFVNAGERMTTISEQMDRAEFLLPLIQPDAVLLVQFQNDLSDLTNQPELFNRRGSTIGSALSDADTAVARSQQEPARRWGQVMYERVPLGNASLVRFLSYRLSAFFITRGIEHDILDSWSVLEDPSNPELAELLKARYRELYAEFVDELRSKNIDVATVIFPSKFDVMAGRYPEGEYFVELARDHDIPFLDLTPLFMEARRPYAFQMYDGHLNPHGNVLAAQEISRWLFGEVAPLDILSRSGRPDNDISTLQGLAEYNLR